MLIYKSTTLIATLMVLCLANAEAQQTTVLTAHSPSLAVTNPTRPEAAPSLKAPVRPQTGYVFNIVDWDGGQLPPLYERSEQLPLRLEGILQLSDAGFADSVIVKMVQQRRCACDASVESLVALKERGVSQQVLQAMSLHALPPNRQITLAIHLDFEGLGGQQQVSTQTRRGYLYLIIPDGDRERVFFGNLRSILGGRWHQDTMTDNADLLLPRKVRRLSFAARVPLKTYGRKRALVFTSTRPDIYTVSNIPESDRRGAMEFVFDYPASSLRQNCSLQVLQRQDSMLADKWHLERSYFECEWD